ncbi:uracil-DNA glycosylase [Chromobacterium alkanivorans]|uniref:uracil-DNA glycosylase n=1 Tax=Chromobacterium TaxID=535 RepID=UPI0006542379|nr:MULTISPECIES: uracil-DNA glycosylase [Chromobacterium]KMN83157.1 uracil-DNA glycosylase [Chromobacterium sp. LK11]MCS3803077.1 uracil-DNA glycosylase [Chromobacterium alkanivorans]MCS3817813.1 uracil-DNA glycosylase [Chromobacterium alkanivorans]MCS3872443.1 uracil-DNA glycosylase [Chromobacterium alkanivorans]
MQALSYLSPALARVHPAWEQVLSTPAIQQQLAGIDRELQAQQTQGKILFPPAPLTFNALTFAAPADVRVVILGQDPYHGDGEAMGLSFSVPPGVRVPPSLRNLYKELAADLGCGVPNSGDLTHWAQQGVLLLNSVFTVERDKAGSHAKLGWQMVSDALIDAVNAQSAGCVFLLWGNWAKTKAERIDASRHLVLDAAHPSPLSASRGFHGCRHFSQVNAWLLSRGRGAVQWGAPAPQNSLF